MFRLVCAACGESSEYHATWCKSDVCLESLALKAGLLAVVADGIEELDGPSAISLRMVDEHEHEVNLSWWKSHAGHALVVEHVPGQCDATIPAVCRICATDFGVYPADNCYRAGHLGRYPYPQWGSEPLSVPPPGQRCRLKGGHFGEHEFTSESMSTAINERKKRVEKWKV